jgi:DNA-binding GntR family transcriptional regulator
MRSAIFDVTLAVRLDGPRTLAEQAERAIQDAILEGAFPPGQRLTIQELADGFGLSPMPIRDALRRLASTGFVEYAAHRGATVASLSVEDLRDTWDARLALEMTAIRRSAEQFTEVDREHVDAAISRHTAYLLGDDHGAARSAHREVHMGLYGPSRYNWLERFVEPIWVRSERYRSYALGQRGGAKQLAREHRQILAACTAHEPELAAERLYVHLVKTANLVAEKLASAALYGPSASSGLPRQPIDRGR